MAHDKGRAQKILLLIISLRRKESGSEEPYRKKEIAKKHRF